MASTFAELYSDFKDSVKIYTEKMDVTELEFMRFLTRGMQVFQRDTEYIEAYAEITKGTDGFFIPDDMIRPVVLKDINGYTLLQQNFKQYTRNLEKWTDGYLETPTDYSMRMQSYLAEQANLRATNDGMDYSTSRLYSIYNREIFMYPDYSDVTIYMWYIPDVHAISINSSQWSTWDSTTKTFATPYLWYPIDTQFTDMFTTRGINVLLAPFEEAFLDYAIAKFLKSQGSANYKVFEQSFKETEQWAKENKPQKFHEGVGEYMFAPYS